MVPSTATCRHRHGSGSRGEMTEAKLASVGCGGFALFVLAFGFPVAPNASAQDRPRRFEEVRRFSADEARQGVAVDERHFYAISNRRIGKYDKESGERVGGWEGAPDGPIIHLDSGIVLDDRLYCAHSNYPGVPMVSSIEVFETATWIDRADGHWWVAFGHYAGRGGVSDQGPAWTNLVKFDESWRRVAGYVYPSEVVERFQEMSNSGGTWGEDGRLYATGHDDGAIFVLSLPTAGSVLELQEVIPVAAEGQGIAWDRSDPRTLYSIIRSTREVVVSKLR